MSNRQLVIGDIHGGLQALTQVLELGGVTPDDLIIFLGDYVDGWSEAVETVDFLRDFKNSHQCILLRGNHDELCCEWLLNGQDNPMWLQHGGASTMKSYAKASGETKDAHIKFYRDLENYYLDEENRLFLHAGFTNLNGIEHEYMTTTYYWDRTLWEMALSLNPRIPETDNIYPKRLLRYKEIYIGHTPVTRIGITKPHNAANVWNVDTGAAFKGPLSLIDVNTKQIWQSDPVHLLYPDETGRN